MRGLIFLRLKIESEYYSRCLLNLQVAAFRDKKWLWGESNIRKTELYVRQERPQDMKEGFRPVFQITITK